MDGRGGINPGAAEVSGAGNVVCTDSGFSYGSCLASTFCFATLDTLISGILFECEEESFDFPFAERPRFVSLDPCLFCFELPLCFLLPLFFFFDLCFFFLCFLDLGFSSFRDDDTVGSVFCFFLGISSFAEGFLATESCGGRFSLMEEDLVRTAGFSFLDVFLDLE